MDLNRMKVSRYSRTGTMCLNHREACFAALNVLTNFTNPCQSLVSHHTEGPIVINRLFWKEYTVKYEAVFSDQADRDAFSVYVDGEKIKLDIQAEYQKKQSIQALEKSLLAPTTPMPVKDKYGWLRKIKYYMSMSYQEIISLLLYVAMCAIVWPLHTGWRFTAFVGLWVINDVWHCVRRYSRRR